MTVTTSPFSSTLFHTLKGLKKKVQGIFQENPECKQLPQLNQNQKKKSDGFIYLFIFCYFAIGDLCSLYT